MADELINFSSCCSRAERIMVDYKGLVELLEIDYIMCDGKRVHVKKCNSCQDHYMEDEEGIEDHVIQTWIAHYEFWRTPNNESDSDGGSSPPNNKE